MDFDRDVGEAGFSLVFQLRITRSMLAVRRAIGILQFPLLPEGEDRQLASPLCAIRVYVLLSRMGIATEDVPAGSGTRTLQCEHRRNTDEATFYNLGSEEYSKAELVLSRLLMPL